MGCQKGATTKTQPGSGPKWTQKPSLKAAQSAALDVTDDEDTCKQTTKTCHTSWTPARTEHLLDWLEENPVDRQKLFSDSTKDAKDEGR
ncbi:hypothetical protein L208DRAFT_1320018 [Tricholoma matsutake]|nr:hypothetical protein L208DRAFT_1320018 [Tricholoma matsutake 945]